MAMQLQEGSSIPVICAYCGKETYQIVLMAGIYRFKCSEDRRWHTKIIIEKDKENNFKIDVSAYYD